MARTTIVLDARGTGRIGGHRSLRVSPLQFPFELLSPIDRIAQNMPATTVPAPSRDVVDEVDVDIQLLREEAAWRALATATADAIERLRDAVIDLDDPDLVAAAIDEMQEEIEALHTTAWMKLTG